jgi:hypothetical protein
MSLIQYYQGVEVLNYFQYVVKANGKQKKIFTVLVDENSGNQLTRYFYEGDRIVGASRKIANAGGTGSVDLSNYYTRTEVDNINQTLLIAAATDAANADKSALTIVGDSTHRFSTDAEKLIWNAKGPRIQSVVSSSTVTPNANSDQLVVITAQATALTLVNPSGTPVDGQVILIRVVEASSSQTITYGSQYRAVGITLPTSTGGKLTYLPIIWNAIDNRWDATGLSQL